MPVKHNVCYNLSQNLEIGITYMVFGINVRVVRNSCYGEWSKELSSYIAWHVEQFFIWHVCMYKEIQALYSALFISLCMTSYKHQHTYKLFGISN